MNIETFNERLEELFAECRNLLNTKGADYSGKQDRFLNFKANGERLGLSKYQIWSVYFAKHIDAIFNSIKIDPLNPKTNSEPLITRVQDAICYLTLLAGMMEEDGQFETPATFIEPQRETPFPLPEDHLDV